MINHGATTETLTDIELPHQFFSRPIIFGQTLTMTKERNRNMTFVMFYAIRDDHIMNASKIQ